MPIYEYSCPECQEEFEVMRIKCEPDVRTVCPQCGAEARKMVSVFASKADYSIKVPAKAAFRGEKPAAGTAKAAAKKAAKPAAAKKTARRK